MVVILNEDNKVEIPQEISKSLNLSPGEKFEIIVYEGRIEFIPVKKITEFRGFLKGIDTSVLRETDRL